MPDVNLDSLHDNYPSLLAIQRSPVFNFDDFEKMQQDYETQLASIKRANYEVNDNTGVKSAIDRINNASDATAQERQKRELERLKSFQQQHEKFQALVRDKKLYEDEDEVRGMKSGLCQTINKSYYCISTQHVLATHIMSL